MGKLLALTSTCAFVLAMSPAIHAGDAKAATKPSAAAESVVYDADSAFYFLKTLTGTWELGKRARPRRQVASQYVPRLVRRQFGD